MLIIFFPLINISTGIDSKNISMAVAVLVGTDTVSEAWVSLELQGLLVSAEHSIRRNSLEDSVAVVSIEPEALAVMAAIVFGSI